MTFGFSSTADDVLEGVDLSGQTVLITGAASGLGQETARAVAAHGASVIMAVRDAERAEPAAEAVRAAAGPEVGGRYCEDCHVSIVTDDPTNPEGVYAYALDPESAAALWTRSEELVGESFPD